MKYKAALIGLGQVAYLFDDNKNKLESSLFTLFGISIE